jgi:hypothetical protein
MGHRFLGGTRLRSTCAALITDESTTRAVKGAASRTGPIQAVPEGIDVALSSR